MLKRNAVLRRSLVSLLTVGVMLAVYALVLAFPEPLFAYSLTHGNFTFRARTPIDPAVRSLADEVQSRVSLSAVYDPAVRHRVFIVDSRMLWFLLNGPYRHAMARNVEIGNPIYVLGLDAARRTIVHFDGRRAGALNVLAHEAMHSYLQRRLGVRAVWRLPWWKKEGYAEYVASQRLSDSEAPHRYQQAARAWKHLLEDRGWSFDQVIAAPLTLDDALKQ